MLTTTLTLPLVHPWTSSYSKGSIHSILFLSHRLLLELSLLPNIVFFPAFFLSILDIHVFYI